MALTVAELAFVFGADDREVNRALAAVPGKTKAAARQMDSAMGGFWRDETKRAKDSARTYDKAGREAGTRFKAGLSNSMRSGIAPLAAVFGGAEIARFFGSSIMAASSLSETINKSRVIFGDASKAIETYAKDSTKNILLTEQQALNASATFGIFAKSAGLTGKELSDFSTSLTGLSSDFSSFFDSSPEEAIEAIGAALRGESEPIRRFGVLLDDATLRNRAFAEGLVDSTKNSLTPAVRVQAAYAEILAQSKDAQGDAARTADGFANSQRALTKAVSELKVGLGEELLPVATAVVQFFARDAIPAISATGGAVRDLGGWFGGLPAPVQAATVAMVAFKVASNMGWIDGAGRGLKSLGQSMDGLRLRTMLVGDSYRQARAGVLEFNGNVGRVVQPAGRASAALTGLRSASMGVGRGFKAGLGGALAMLGGPWGIAFAAGTAAVASFWSANEKAKAEVKALSATLDEQTGSVTDNTRAHVANALQASGAADASKKFGISAADLTDAALGNEVAIERVTKALEAEGFALYKGGNGFTDFISTISGAVGMSDEMQSAAERVSSSINQQTGDLAKARDGHEFLSEAMAGSTTATERATAVTVPYAQATQDAADAIKRLRSEENQRRKDRVQDRRDALGLIMQTQEARKEAKKGKETLDENTKAGQENMTALLDLADQWNNSSTKVRNAKGAYVDMRDEFIKIATAMSGNEKQARQLARELLTIPKNVPIDVQSDKMKDALKTARNLRWILNNMATPGQVAAGALPKGFAPAPYADGGPIKGWGGPRADKVPIMASPDEFIVPNGPSQKHRRLLEAVRRDDPAAIAMSAGAAGSGHGIDYERLGQSVAAALGGGRIAPVMQVGTMRVNDMREAERHARTQAGLAAVS